MIGHVLRFSAGITSWGAGERLRQRGVPFLSVFADTIVEDEDTYRFLIEGAALLDGLELDDVADLSELAGSIPPLEPGTKEFRAARLAVRKRHIHKLRESCNRRIESLRWIADGRTPWEVFRDERFIGNSRVDPCSKILKRKLLDKWVEQNCTRETIHVLGLDWSEPKRRRSFTEAFAPRRVAFPMADEPFVLKQELLLLARSVGLKPPRLYDWGFPHGNCGGFCVKAGQREGKRLLESRRNYFLYNEQEEQDTRDELGRNDVAVLRDRRGGTSKALTLAQFRENVEAGGAYDDADRGQCHCFEVERDDE